MAAYEDLDFDYSIIGLTQEYGLDAYAAPPADHCKKHDPEVEKKLLDAYYEFKGWNADGIPAGQTLNRLGLAYVREDFVQRDILDKR